MLSPYRLVIGPINLPPSDANLKVIFPTIPSSLSKVTRYLLSHQGAADAVVVSSMVDTNATHIIFFFIISSFPFGHKNTDILEFHSSNMSVSFSKHSIKNLAPNLNPFINV